MKFNILTIFPDFFDSFKETSIINSAIKNNFIDINTFNIRDFAEDKHKMTDDYPFGGGSGMVMKAEPVAKCLDSVMEKFPSSFNILLSPQGKVFNQSIAKEFSTKKNINIICPRYEGIDERIHSKIDMELSIGDFILSGGEVAACVVIDATARLIKGVLGNETSLDEESFHDGLLEYPQYTRPESINLKGKDLKVPKILLSGNHGEIYKWRRVHSLIRTAQKRPDLLLSVKLNKVEKDFIDRYLTNKLTSDELEFIKGNLQCLKTLKIKQ